MPFRSLDRAAVKKKENAVLLATICGEPFSFNRYRQREKSYGLQ
jgi:hypothetical protein